MTHKNKYTQNIYATGNVKFVFKIENIYICTVSRIKVYCTEEVLIFGNDSSLSLFTYISIYFQYKYTIPYLNK